MEKILHYRDIKGAGEIEPGTIIEGVKPRDLYTTQPWIDITKACRVLGRVPQDPVLPSRGYLFRRDDGRTKLVLGDGNTRAIAAWEAGDALSFEVVGLLPENVRAFPLSRLRHQFRDLAWCMNE